MCEYPLLKQFVNSPINKESISSNGVKYQQYEINVSGILKTVSIPLRETQAFERSLIEEGSYTITEHMLRDLLRKFRGIGE